ncbi:hypothetical protein K0M31_012946 [Melipona bicolor]|uniref:Uncharacterized protein n=1 Tax=Melipona bicolor TaxID=60889 RepID=A0AA40FIU1_9HYME|nr:hypothetical protein K0M31_012946 [Melipona bicolor]
MLNVAGSASIFTGATPLNGGAAEEESSGTTSKRERKINVRRAVRCKVKSKEPGRAATLLFLLGKSGSLVDPTVGVVVARDANPPV